MEVTCAAESGKVLKTAAAAIHWAARPPPASRAISAATIAVSPSSTAGATRIAQTVSPKVAIPNRTRIGVSGG